MMKKAKNMSTAAQEFFQGNQENEKLKTRLEKMSSDQVLSKPLKLAIGVVMRTRFDKKNLYSNRMTKRGLLDESMISRKGRNIRGNCRILSFFLSFFLPFHGGMQDSLDNPTLGNIHSGRSNLSF